MTTVICSCAARRGTRSAAGEPSPAPAGSSVERLSDEAADRFRAGKRFGLFADPRRDRGKLLRLKANADHVAGSAGPAAAGCVEMGHGGRR